MTAAVEAHRDWIQGETLAVEIAGSPGAAGEPSIRIERI